MYLEFETWMLPEESQDGVISSKYAVKESQGQQQLGLTVLAVEPDFFGLPLRRTVILGLQQ